MKCDFHVRSAYHGKIHEKSTCVKKSLVALSTRISALGGQKYEVGFSSDMRTRSKNVWKTELRKKILSSVINHNIGIRSTKIETVILVTKMWWWTGDVAITLHSLSPGMTKPVCKEPPVGIEPTTVRLRSACSANWAKEAPVERTKELMDALVCLLTVVTTWNNDPPRTRTWNLRLRRPTPYPLGQRAMRINRRSIGRPKNAIS